MATPTSRSETSGATTSWRSISIALPEFFSERPAQFQRSCLLKNFSSSISSKHHVGIALQTHIDLSTKRLELIFTSCPTILSTTVLHSPYFQMSWSMAIRRNLFLLRTEQELSSSYLADADITFTLTLIPFFPFHTLL